MIPACNSRVGFSTAPVSFGSWLLPTLSGDLFGLFRRVGLRTLELEFAMPSLNDRVSRTMTFEMLTNQCPVASTMSADDPC